MSADRTRTETEQRLAEIRERLSKANLTHWAAYPRMIGWNVSPANAALAHGAPDDIAFLLAELDASRRDAARLDWLEQHDDRFYNIDKVSAKLGSGFSVGGLRVMTLREAIDAAMSRSASPTEEPQP
jgi:hypothetical protein